MGLIDTTLATTKKELGKISPGKDGHFFFVGTPDGAEAALLVLSESKDKDGDKTRRQGKSLLKEFKKEHRNAVFSHGVLKVEGSRLVFEIATGPARPRVLTASFKKSKSLHAGIGPKKSALVSAKVGAAGQKKAPAEAAPEQDAALESFRTTPEVRKLIVELGLSNGEVSELFEAEAQFSRLSEHLPTDNDLEQDEQALATERTERLSEIHDDEGALEALVRSGDPSKARELEDRLDTRRIELAAVSSVGIDSFEEGTLSETDRSALLAMNNVGLRQLLSRITGLKDAVRKVEEDDTLTPEEVLTQQVGLRRQLIELQGQLSAYRQ